MKWIGFGVLFPWLRYRFASRRMTPRFDEHGRVYMLICQEPMEHKIKLKPNPGPETA